MTSLGGVARRLDAGIDLDRPMSATPSAAWWRCSTRSAHPGDRSQGSDVIDPAATEQLTLKSEAGETDHDR